MNGVFFPNKFDINYVSNRLASFFHEYNIVLNEPSFSLDTLRKVYKKDRKKFELIVKELQLRGFNIISTTNPNMFFPPILEKNITYILSSDDGVLTPSLLNTLGLWDSLYDLELFNKKNLNYVPIKRLELYSDIPYSLESALRVNGFIIFDEETKKNQNTPSKQNKNHEIKKHFGFPRFLLSFLCELIKMPESIYKLVAESQFNRLANLLEINHVQKQKLISKAYMVDSFTSRATQFEAVLNNFFLELLNCKKDFKIIMNKHSFLNQCLLSKLLFMPYDNEKYLYCKEDLHKFRKKYVIFDFTIESISQVCRKDIRNNNIYLDDIHFHLGINMFQVKYLNQIGINRLNDFRKFNIDSNLTDFKRLEREANVINMDLFNIFDIIDCEINHKPIPSLISLDTSFHLAESKISINDYFYSIRNIKLSINSIEIIRERENNKTLSEIGNQFNLTRERIRQIEKRFAVKTENLITIFLDKLFQYRKYYDLEDLKLYPGIITHIKFFNDKYIIIDDYKIIIRFTDSSLFNYLIEKINKNIFVEEKTLNLFEDKEGFCIKHYFVEQMNNNSNIQNQYFLTTTLTYREKGILFLKECKENGYLHPRDFNYAKDYFYNRFGDTVDNERNMLTYIGDNAEAVLRNYSHYIHKNFVSDSQIKTASEILYDFNLGQYGEYAKNIYEKNTEKLQKHGIDNHVFLYGILKSFEEKKFNFSGRNMRISRNEILSIPEIIENHLKKNKGRTSILKISEDLNLSLSSITQAISGNIIKIDSKYLGLRNDLKISNKEYNNLIKIINKNISKKGYCHTIDIIEEVYYDDKKNIFLKKNKINNDSTKLIYFVNNVFGDIYNYAFFINVITDKMTNMNSVKDLVLKNFLNKTFTKKDIRKFLSKHHYSINNIFPTEFNNIAIPIDRDRYKLKQDIKHSTEILDIINITNENFSKNSVILIKELLREIRHFENYREYEMKPVELCALISTHSLSNWVMPINDLQHNTNQYKFILANKKFFENEPILMSEVIRKYVFENKDGYLTFEDVIEFVIEHELLEINISNLSINKIFEGYIEMGLIRVVK